LLLMFQIHNVVLQNLTLCSVCSLVSAVDFLLAGQR
jgi:hypothetical protein